jgi:saccharopine dehydrogenase (NAD+, L-lysine-forming)
MNKPVKIALIKEGKTPPDFRVALTPSQCQEILQKFPQISIVVESSPIRRFTDEEYIAAGIPVSHNISDADIMIGVKEVPEHALIPDKTYLFFSHTFKKQPYNAHLLRAILEKNIRLVDYEVLKDETGKRVIGFGILWCKCPV